MKGKASGKAEAADGTSRRKTWGIRILSVGFISLILLACCYVAGPVFTQEFSDQETAGSSQGRAGLDTLLADI